MEAGFALTGNKLSAKKSVHKSHIEKGEESVLSRSFPSNASCSDSTSVKVIHCSQILSLLIGVSPSDRTDISGPQSAFVEQQQAISCICRALFYLFVTVQSYLLPLL